MERRQALIISASLLYALSYLFLLFRGYYVVSYAAFLVSFLLLFPRVKDTRFFQWLSKLSYRQQLAAVFLVSLSLRFLLLLQDQVITNDIDLYVERSRILVEQNKTPYVEEEMNKPPMYVYYLYFFGKVFAPDHNTFRAVASFFDALVSAAVLPLVMKIYYGNGKVGNGKVGNGKVGIGNRKYGNGGGNVGNGKVGNGKVGIGNRKYGNGGGNVREKIKNLPLEAGLLYALCPVPIIMSGLSGHYEPLVILLTMAAMFFVLAHSGKFEISRASQSNRHGAQKNNSGKFKGKQDKYNSLSLLIISSLALGLGFAFKIYPLVLMPLFAWKMGSWKRRFAYAGIFFLPMALSFLPLLKLWPGAATAYFDYQGSDWMDSRMKSFSRSWLIISGSDVIFGMNISYFFFLVFILVLVAMFTEWTKFWNEIPWLFNFPGNFMNRLPGKVRQKLYSLYDFQKNLSETAAAERWFAFLVFLFVLYYWAQASVFPYVFEEEFNDLPLSHTVMCLIFSAAFIIVVIPLVLRKKLYIAKMESALIGKEGFLFFSVIAIMLVLFGSPDYATWYIPWFLPFLLAMENHRIKTIFLWLVVWNFPGETISLLPGVTI